MKARDPRREPKGYFQPLPHQRDDGEWRSYSRSVRESRLSAFEDRFREHPVTPTTVVFPINRLTYFNDNILPLIRANRLTKVSHGWRKDGLAVTMKTEHDAMMLKLIYEGETL